LIIPLLTRNVNFGKFKVHTTGAYLASQFEAPLVAFSGSFSDSGQVPYTGAGYYNRLRVNIGLNVQQGGTYTIAGQLDGAAGPIAVAGTSFNLNLGNQTIYLDFSGQAIFHHRQNGPYQLRFLRVLDSSGQEVDYLYNAYTTDAYSYSQFQNSSTIIDASSFGHQTLDLNKDGDYEYLRVTFKAKVHLNGNYILSAQLKDSSGMLLPP